MGVATEWISCCVIHSVPQDWGDGVDLVPLNLETGRDDPLQFLTNLSYATMLKSLFLNNLVSG